MTHLRKTIRNVVTTAVTGLATTNLRVYKSRRLPLTEVEYPCLCVYVRSDTPDYSEAAFDNSVAWPVRTIDLHIQGHAKDEDSVRIEELLDDLAEEVEVALFAAFLAGSLTGVKMLTLGEQTLSFDPEGEETMGVIDMVFNVSYRAAEGAPGTSV